MSWKELTRRRHRDNGDWAVAWCKSKRKGRHLMLGRGRGVGGGDDSGPGWEPSCLEREAKLLGATTQRKVFPHGPLSCNTRHHSTM